MATEGPVEVLREQIRALGTDADVMIAIIQEAIKRDFTFTKIKTVLKEHGYNPSTKTLYGYLRKLTESHLLIASEKKPRTWKFGEGGILDFLKTIPPDVRFSKSPESWGPGGRREIIESLCEELEISSDEADKISRRVEEYAKGLGYVHLRRLSKSTIRELVVEALREMMDNAKSETERNHFAILAHNYSPERFTARFLEEVLRKESNQGLHFESPADRLMKNYNLRKIPPSLIVKSRRGMLIYLHGLPKIFQPLSLNHDMRWFFHHGIKSPFHSSRPPQHFETSLACVSAVLSLCQSAIGGPQTIDHFNLLIAPFTKELGDPKNPKFERELKQHLDSFLYEVWRLYVARPLEPVYSSVMLEFENSPIEDSPLVFKGRASEEEFYREYWSYARALGNIFLQLMSKKKEEFAITPIFPRVFLKVSTSLIEETEKIKNETWESILSIIKSADPKRIPVYFINTDSPPNKDSKIHFSYFPDIQRITSDGVKDDQRKGVLTFCTLNMPEILEEVKKIDRADFTAITQYIEDLIKATIDLDRAKRKELRGRLEKGDQLLPVLTMVDPTDPDRRYYDLDNSTLHVGIGGLYLFLNKLGLDIHESEDFDQIVRFLRRLTESMEAFSKQYSLPIRMSQPPSRSGVYKRFLGVSEPPKEWFNLTPPDAFNVYEEQLEREAKLHQLLPGGAVSRVYVPSNKLEDVDDMIELLRRITRTEVSLFKIIPEKEKEIRG